MTSTDSISSALIWRKSVPTNAVLENPPCDSVPLLDMGTPSMMMLDPNALVLLFTRVRSCTLERDVKSVFFIKCPGISCITSSRLIACKWSIACLPMIELVDSPATFCLATTTTSFRASEVGVMRIVRSRFCSTLISRCTVSKPTYEMFKMYFHVGIFFSTAFPSMSVAA